MKPILYRGYDSRLEIGIWIVVTSVFDLLSNRYYKIYHYFNSEKEARSKFPNTIYEPNYKVK